MEILRTCTKCNDDKPLDQFHKDQRAKNGYSTYCKLCNLLRRKLYKENNIDKVRETAKKHNSKPYVKLKHNLRSRIYIAFKVKSWIKGKGTEQLLGCDWQTARKHIERQFTKGMSWDNQGKWHIDHEIPLASANTEKEARELCHYTNLQPLWSKDNLEKGNKIDGQQNKLRL